MAGKNGHNIANGVIAAFVLACGITLCVLVSSLLKKAVDIINDSSSDTLNDNVLNSSLPVWTLGLAYVVPGLFGVLSAFAKVKGMYITHMVFCILTLIVMGIFFILCILALGTLAVYSPNSCLTEGNICKCGGDNIPSTYNTSCEDLNSMFAMAVSIMVIVVLAWILTLTNTIIVGILACRREPLQQGIVVQPMPGVVHMSCDQRVISPAGYINVQQTHDGAKLVPNMQY